MVKRLIFSGNEAFCTVCIAIHMLGKAIQLNDVSHVSSNGTYFFLLKKVHKILNINFKAQNSVIISETLRLAECSASLLLQVRSSNALSGKNE